MSKVVTKKDRCMDVQIKSPALWAGPLSGFTFVKRDAEPSECECSLGEFLAEVLQCLTHLPALAGRKASLPAVDGIAVHFLHKPCPAFAEVGFGNIAQTDGLGDVAHQAACSILTRHVGHLFHVISNLADSFQELLGRNLFRLWSLVDHVFEKLLGLRVFDVVCYSFHICVCLKESPRRALLLIVLDVKNQVEDYFPALEQSVDEFGSPVLGEVCAFKNRFDCPVTVFDAFLVEFKFFHLHFVWFNMLMISFDIAKVINICLIAKETTRNKHLFNNN